MLKLVALLVLLFLALLAWRGLRLLLASAFGPRSARRGEPSRVEGEMVRDPVCGVWIDRRLALSAGSGARGVSVCSERCRRLAESSQTKVVS